MIMAIVIILIFVAGIAVNQYAFEIGKARKAIGPGHPKEFDWMRGKTTFTQGAPFDFCPHNEQLSPDWLFKEDIYKRKPGNVICTDPCEWVNSFSDKYNPLRPQQGDVDACLEFRGKRIFWQELDNWEAEFQLALKHNEEKET